MDKAKLRRELRQIRDQLDIETREEYSKKIREEVMEMELYQQAQALSCFVTFGSEVNTIPLIKIALAQGKRVFLPITKLAEGRLIFSEVKDFEQELELGTYGILEPKPEYIRPVSETEIDLVLMPGLVFDRKGYRIGYGGGFYDKFLAGFDSLPERIALAFDIQVRLEPVPYDEYDIPTNFIVTEKEIIHCKENRKREGR